MYTYTAHNCSNVYTKHSPRFLSQYIVKVYAHVFNTTHTFWHCETFAHISEYRIFIIIASTNIRSFKRRHKNLI